MDKKIEKLTAEEWGGQFEMCTKINELIDAYNEYNNARTIAEETHIELECLQKKMEKIITYIGEVYQEHKIHGFAVPVCLKRIEQIINQEE